jgi:hypothetical protein
MEPLGTLAALQQAWPETRIYALHHRTSRTNGSQAMQPSHLQHTWCCRLRHVAKGSNTSHKTKGGSTYGLWPADAQDTVTPLIL